MGLLKSPDEWMRLVAVNVIEVLSIRGEYISVKYIQG